MPASLDCYEALARSSDLFAGPQLTPAGGRQRLRPTSSGRLASARTMVPCCLASFEDYGGSHSYRADLGTIRGAHREHKDSATCEQFSRLPIWRRRNGALNARTGLVAYASG